ncbi:hypothetical protein [Synechococcus phage MinM1]|nr:hypothetical protein [Synechococcus phage MinM1]
MRVIRDGAPERRGANPRFGDVPLDQGDQIRVREHASRIRELSHSWQGIFPP